MKLLLGANISWRLTAVLKNHFEDCIHIDFSGLASPASDMEIWNFASVNDLIIITNDEDFLNFVNLKGFPPKVVLLRTGNQANSHLADILIKHKEDIQQLCLSADIGLLEIF
jgi:predicted nuclease of predicted toxin-antitoxin system